MSEHNNLEFDEGCAEIHKKVCIQRNPGLKYKRPGNADIKRQIVNIPGRNLYGIYNRAFGNCTENQPQICWNYFQGKFCTLIKVSNTFIDLLKSN